MDNVTLNRLKELLSVPSKTYQEDRMVNYLLGVMKSIEGVDVYTDEYKNIYATKGNVGNGYFPMFIAHTDTVHELEDVIVVDEAMLPKPPTFGKTFDSELHRVLRAFTPEGNPTGIGGDDKCGVFIALELLRKLDTIKVGLFVSEETGCHGSSKCDLNFLQDVGYVVQFDAPGNHLITEICSGVRLFEENGEFINRALPVIEKTMGTTMLRQSHPYTDVSQIKKKADISCINISCGYYNMHTKNEFVCIQDVEDSLNTAMALVEEFGFEKQPYTYEPPKFTQYSMFNVNDLDDDDMSDWDNTLSDGLDEDEDISTEYNDIILSYGSLNITSKLTGESVFLDEQEVEDLYEILRERINRKYWDV